MKKIIIIIACFIFVHQKIIYCQNECDAVPTAAYLAALDASMNSIGCVDDFNEFDITEQLTFNLYIDYADPSIDKAAVESEINAIYNVVKIYFNYIWNDINCSACITSYAAWPPLPSYPNCINGHLYTGGFLGDAAIGGGKFMADLGSIPHEIGHAMGLLHTHHSNDSFTNELVRRVDDSTCDCNCLQEGDKVCDTQPDPFVPLLSDPNAESLNDRMFNQTICEVDNLDNLTDSCGDLYSNANSNSMNNVMSYHWLHEHACPKTLTDGQSLMIRRSLSNGDGTYQYQLDPNDPPLVTSQPILNPTTINTNSAYHGDLIIRSELRIEDCDFELTPGSLIIIEAGGSLVVKNATIKTYEGSQCYESSSSIWGGIKIDPSPTVNTKLRVTHQSDILESEQGILTDGSGLLEFKIYDSTLEGNINLSYSIGIQRLRESTVNGQINLTENFIFNIEGCELSNTINSVNTHLRVTDNATTGTKTKFNLGSSTFGRNGVVFNSSNAHNLFVQHTDMEYCNNCLDINNTMGIVRISDSDFTLADMDDGFEHDCIEIDNVEDFEIYQNTFIGGDIVRQFGINYNSMSSENANANTIIDNTFDGLKNGISNSNGDFGNTLSGIEFKCNTFTNVNLNDITPFQDIGPRHGNPSGSAGNIFSYGAGVDFRYQGSNDSKYYFKQTNVGEEPLLFSKISIINTLLDKNCTYPPQSGPLGPPTKMEDGPGFTGGSGEIENLINLIKDSSAFNTDTVISILTDLSPWVPIKVIHTLLDNSTHYTETEVTTIISVNPGVIYDNYIYDIVFNSNSFSQDNQDTILNDYPVEGDARINYEELYSDTLYSWYPRYRDTMYTIWNDSIIDYAASNNALNDKNSNRKSLQMAEYRMMQEDWTLAQDAIDDIDDYQSLDPYIAREIDKYKELLDIEYGLRSGGTPIADINQTDLSTYLDAADLDYGIATAKARSLLAIYLDTIIDHDVIPFAYDGIVFKSEINRSVNKSTIGKEWYSIYPNPTKDDINLVIDGFDGNNAYELSIFNVSGEKVLDVKLQKLRTSIDVSDLNEGVYMTQLMINQEIISTKKLIIIN